MTLEGPSITRKEPSAPAHKFAFLCLNPSSIHDGQICTTAMTPCIDAAGQEELPFL